MYAGDATHMGHHKFIRFGPDGLVSPEGPGEGSLVRGPPCQGPLGLVFAWDYIL